MTIALGIFVLASFHGNLVVYNDSFNAIAWVSSSSKFPQQSQFCFKKIKFISSLLQINFQQVERIGNGFAVYLANSIIPKVFLAAAGYWGVFSL